MSDSIFRDFVDPPIIVESLGRSEEVRNILVTEAPDAPTSSTDAASRPCSFHARRKSSNNTLTSEDEASLTPILGSDFIGQSSAFAPIPRGKHSRMHSLDEPPPSLQVADGQGSENIQDSDLWQPMSQQWYKSGELQGASSQQELQTELGMRGPGQTPNGPSGTLLHPQCFQSARGVEYQTWQNSMRGLTRPERDQNLAAEHPTNLNVDEVNTQSTYTPSYKQDVAPSVGYGYSAETLNTMPTQPIGFTSLISGSAGNFSAQTGALNNLHFHMQNTQGSATLRTTGSHDGQQWTYQLEQPSGHNLGQVPEPSSQFVRPFGKIAESYQSMKPRDSGQQEALQSIEDLLDAAFASSNGKQETSKSKVLDGVFTDMSYTWSNTRAQSYGSDVGVDYEGGYDSSGNPTDPFQGAAEKVLHLSPQTKPSNVQSIPNFKPSTAHPDYQGAPVMRFGNDVLEHAQTALLPQQRSHSGLGAPSLAGLMPPTKPEAQGTLRTANTAYPPPPSVSPYPEQRITEFATAGNEALATRTLLGQLDHSRTGGGRGSRGSFPPRSSDRGSAHASFRSKSQVEAYRQLNVDPRSAVHSRSSTKTAQTPCKRTARKQSYRRRQSQRTLDSLDGDGTDPRQLLRIPLEIPGLTSPHLTTGPSQLLNPPRGIFWSLTRNFSMPIPPVDNRRVGELSQLVNPLMDIHFEIPYEPNGDISTVPIRMCQPPLFDHLPPYPKSLDPDALPRARKQSKYTQQQDQTILDLKAKGYNWADIARAADCQNQLAARNRYQVLIGQQGGAAFFWTADDCAVLQSFLDEAERAKWLYIAEELSKKLNRHITLAMVHFRVAHIFCEDSLRFGIVQRKSRQKGAPPLQRLVLDREARDELIQRARKRVGGKQRYLG